MLLGLLCSDARTLGHDARMLRVYYDGTDRGRDAEVSERLTEWLVDQRIDLVVADRVLATEPFAQWKARRPGSRLLLLPPPEGMGRVVAADAALGYRPYERREEHGEMGDEVRRAFAMWLATGLAPPRRRRHPRALRGARRAARAAGAVLERSRPTGRVSIFVRSSSTT